MRHITVFSASVLLITTSDKILFHDLTTCIGSSVQWTERNNSLWSKRTWWQNKGCLDILKWEEKYQDWENVSSQVRLLEQYRDIQNSDLILHYDMSQRWPLGYMMIQTCDLWPDPRLLKICTHMSSVWEIITKWILYFPRCSRYAHTLGSGVRILTKWILIFHH